MSVAPLTHELPEALGAPLTWRDALALCGGLALALQPAPPLSLREAREARGLTLEALALRSGLSAAVVEDLEAGVRWSTLAQVVTLGAALELAPAELGRLLRWAARQPGIAAETLARSSLWALVAAAETMGQGDDWLGEAAGRVIGEAEAIGSARSQFTARCCRG